MLDAGMLSGIAAVITACLLPFVTRASAGGHYAKVEQAEAEAKLELKEKELILERASGLRWYRLFIVWHTRARSERSDRMADRTVMRTIPGAPLIEWPDLERIPSLDEVMDEDRRNNPL